jgi:lipopolysaccharide transport system ATP-binding protein
VNEIAIRAENLGKRYHIGSNSRHRPVDVENPLPNGGSGLGRFFGHSGKEEILWALQGVNFEINWNEVVGIIGRNGSGKSTLLKILSRVTEPTVGVAELHGRSSSLLEVGTGFHPELTGRENIYLNGSILGMKRREIDAKFRAIVDFSEIEKFIDTPIKRYSSGMGVRLAFAVAAHLEPEILMVDEVLAVGDLNFQRKCLEKMKDVVHHGKTVLFVTHQMNAVRRLCTRCIWMEDGTVKLLGETAEVVAAYESASLSRSSASESENGPSQFLGWEIVESAPEDPHWLVSNGPVTLKFTVRIKETLHNAQQGLALWNANDELMWGMAISNLSMEPGIHEFVFSLSSLPLKPGTYRWHLSLCEGAKVVDEWYAVPEMVIATQPLSHHSDQWTGILNVPCEFKLNRIR